MTSTTVDFFTDVMQPDNLAVKITEQFMEWDMLRSNWKADKQEIRKYVYATDTTQTTNSALPWKNKTTLPKLCNIRDNLYSNYTATCFPQRKWLIWEANERDANSVQKKNAIVNYMAWAIEQPQFKQEVDKIILDYIDYGNCFATVEWIDDSVLQKDGNTKVGYIGPGIRRINPWDIVFNPTTENFENSPKIIRSLMSKGEVKKLIKRLSDGMQEEHQALWDYLMDIRGKANHYEVNSTQERDALYAMDGFTSFREYLESDWIEVLTFYGDIYDDENDVLLENYVVTVVDRHKLIGKKPNPSYFAKAPIYHSPWRRRQDNLWGMGPLDNLVGMQYRLDHIENMRADIVDLTTYPVQMVTGFVEDYVWQPGQKIFAGDDGKVELVQPQVQVLNANFDLQRYEATMEEMAGAPKEAMGFRTPGEKTKYEVQRLENAASRVFQNKIKQFEEQVIEPLLNAMLELARRNLTETLTIKVFDDETKATMFQTLTAEDITGIGRIRPIAARHFAEEANFIQNLTNLASSGLWPLVQPHFSGIKLAKALENLFQMDQYEIILPYIGLAEAADGQKMANALQEQVLVNAMTATGMNGDFDIPEMQALAAQMQQMQMAQQQAQQQPGGGGGPPPGGPPPQQQQQQPQGQPFNLRRQPPANAEPGGVLATQ